MVAWLRILNRDVAWSDLLCLVCRATEKGGQERGKVVPSSIRAWVEAVLFDCRGEFQHRRSQAQDPSSLKEPRKHSAALDVCQGSLQQMNMEVVRAMASEHQDNGPQC